MSDKLTAPVRVTVGAEAGLGWQSVPLLAAPVSFFVLALYYYWYAVANRYLIFLYTHLGAGPFDRLTRGRYWMAGLVASGMVLCIYVPAQWALGRLARRRQRAYVPPPWTHVWALAAIPLVIGIPLITMSFNQPTLPPWLAAACVAATLAGLALALMPAELAARDPKQLAWLVFDGLALVPALQLTIALELPGRGLNVPISKMGLWLLVAASFFGGGVWLYFMSRLHKWRAQAMPSFWQLFAAGLAMEYLLLPLVHYFSHPGFNYITSASNFFAFNPAVQGLAFVLALILAGFGHYLGQNGPARTTAV